jgi:hypothetical protein
MSKNTGNKKTVVLSVSQKRNKPKKRAQRPSIVNRKLNLKSLENKVSGKQVSFIKEEFIPLTKSRKLVVPKPMRGFDPKTGDLMVTYTELVTTLTSITTTNGLATGFNMYIFHVNPGLKSSFPFLSSMAANYTDYRFAKLELIFVPRGNVTRDGNIAMSAEFNSDAKPPESRKELLIRKNAVETQVFQTCVLTCDGSDMAKENAHYIRLQKLSPSANMKLYDAALLYYSYEGVPSNTLLGDIFVTYTVRLITPKFREAEKQIASIESNIGMATAGTATANLPLGAMTAASFIGDFIGVGLSTLTGGLSGQFFSTAKSVLKLITGLFPPAAGGYSNPVGLTIGARAGNTYSSNSNLIDFIEEDDSDILNYAVNSASLVVFNQNFTDLTSGNVFQYGSSIDQTTSYTTRQWAVAWPANTVLRVFTAAVGNGPSVLAPSISFTDYDPVKTGNLPVNGLLQFTYNFD